ENNTDNISLRIIEVDANTAEELSDKFDRSFVILGSGMDKDILNEAEISNADILISLTNSDETNFISAAFAKSDGCERVIALLNNKDFQGLIRSVDIGDFLDPKAITVSSILRHVRRGHIRNIYTLSDGTAEIIEGEVSSSSDLVGPTIEELHLSNGLRIGGILRNQKIIMPRGDTKIKEGDYVTIFAIPDKIHEVEQLFRVSASYY
ncbi:MAG: TrkA C-terminal domain-containing protein, partial [Pseudomonadota bacterium]|nr:TrkA C-terminal domain-containing protein [Pseudomonadota bacterium]